MAATPMSGIKPRAIAAVEPLQGPAQVGFRRLEQQVIVIVHQAISMANPVKTLDDLCKRIEEEFAIAVIFENRLAVISDDVR